MREIPITNPGLDFTDKYLAAFREPLPEDETQVMLQDKLQTGWLAWGKKIEVYRFTGWDEQAWPIDPTSKDALAVFETAISAPGWWEKVCFIVCLLTTMLMRQIAEFWSQEGERTYPSATHIDFVLSLSQLYGISVFEAVRPIIEAYMSEMDAKKVYDRHKMRALWEFLAGLLRGSEEWPGKDRARFWEWLTPKLPELFSSIRHDTVKSACRVFPGG